MKCSNHSQTDAVAICVFCGHGLCSSCATKSTTGRAICSPACSAGIAAAEAALESIRQKTIGANKLAVYFLLGAGILFVGFAIYEAIRAMSSGRWILSLFLGSTGVAFIVIGAAWSQMVRQKE